MWTPKRVFLLASGLVFFLSAYIVYGSVLGLSSINGLPQLPAPYCDDSPDSVASPTLPAENVVKLKKAFGETCEELQYPIKIWVGSKRICLAAADYDTNKAGQLILSQFRIAIFGQEMDPNRCPEINTASSNQAVLTFDHPIQTLSDIGKYKVVAGELVGDIKIRNNRRSSDPLDGILVFIKPKAIKWFKITDYGLDSLRREEMPEAILAKLKSLKDNNFEELKHLSAALANILTMEELKRWEEPVLNHAREPEPARLYFDDKMAKIWSDGDVVVWDYQNKANPTHITAVGLEVKLAREDGKSPPAAARKAKNDNVSGVDTIQLLSQVNMDMYVDSDSGFLSPAKTAPAQKSGVTEGVQAANSKTSQQASKCGDSPDYIPVQLAVFNDSPLAKLTWCADYFQAKSSKCLVNIRTPGPFLYEVANERAQFDISPLPIALANRVVAQRIHEGLPGNSSSPNNKVIDVLDCERLEIQFRRKSVTTPRQATVINRLTWKLPVRTPPARKLFFVQMRSSSMLTATIFPIPSTPRIVSPS